MQQPRLVWPDATRGLGVIAVVLFHTLIWHYQPFGSPSSKTGGTWSMIDTILGRTRMPVLFALSGLLAASGLSRGWTNGTAVRRFVSNYYLYAVWLVVYFAFFALIPLTPSSPSDQPSLLVQLALPNTTLWFIFALATYPLVVVALRALKIPVWAIVTLAAGAWLLGNSIDIPLDGDKLARNFLFFVLGVYGGPILRRIAGLRWPATIAFCAVFVVFAQIGLHVENSWVVSPLVLMTNLAAIPAVISAVAQLCKIPSLARTARFIGTRTLHVYVLHIPVLSLITLLLAGSNELREMLSSSKIIDLVYPVVITALCTAASLFLGYLIDRVSRGRAFALPARIDKILSSRETRMDRRSAR